MLFRQPPLNDTITKDVGERRQVDLKFTPANQFELANIDKATDEGIIAGWASTPDIDRSGDVIVAGAFDESINSKGLKGPKGIKLLVGHNFDKIAGVITVLETREDRLWIEAQLNLELSYVADLFSVMKMIGGLNFSVGFRLQEDGYEFRKTPGGMEYFEVIKADLMEVSIVAIPDNEEAVMQVVKSEKGGLLDTVAKFEKALVAQGFASSRNKAHDLVKVIKANINLFTDTVAPVVPDAPKSLTSDNLTGIQKALDNMKAILVQSRV